MQVKGSDKNFRFDALFSGLPAPVARDFAQMLRAFASFLEHQADEAEAREQRLSDNLALFEWFSESLPRLMAEAKESQPDDDNAALLVSAKSGVQPSTVLHYWKKDLRRRREQERRDRNKAILEMDLLGWPQVKIAAKAGVSQATVSRVIKTRIRYQQTI